MGWAKVRSNGKFKECTPCDVFVFEVMNIKGPDGKQWFVAFVVIPTDSGEMIEGSRDRCALHKMA